MGILGNVNQHPFLSIQPWQQGGQQRMPLPPPVMRGGPAIAPVPEYGGKPVGSSQGGGLFDAIAKQFGQGGGGNIDLGQLLMQVFAGGGM